MSKVARAEQPKPQGQDLLTKFREACAKQNIDPQDVAKAAGLNFGELTDADMPKLRDAFKTLTTKPAEPPVSKQVQDAEAFIARVQEAFPTAAAVAATPQIKDPDAPASKAQIGKVRAMMSGKGIASYQDKIEKAQDLLNLPNLKQLEQLTKGQANLLINMVEEMK